MALLEQLPAGLEPPASAIRTTAPARWEDGAVVSESDQDPSPRLRGAQGTAAKPPRHLADLTPAERKARLEELGLPGFRARQLSTHYFSRLVDDPEQMTDLPAGQRAELVEGLLPHLMTPLKTQRGRQGHHPQDALEALRRRARRVGADALPGPRHDVRLQPGRLRHGLPLLRDRPGRAAAQHVHRPRSSSRSSPVPGRSRATRWPAGPGASPTWCSWAWASRWPTTRP